MPGTRIVLVVIALILAVAKSNGQSAADTLRCYLIDAAADGQINGATLIGQDGRIFYETNFGFADPSKRRLSLITRAFP